jgi:hypothetical protein
MDMYHPATVVMVEQVLAPRVGLPEDMTVDRGGAVGEPTLGAAHAHRRPAEPALMQAGQPMQGVTLRHWLLR